MSIIKQPRNSQPLLVDYGKSALELAIHALSIFAAPGEKLNQVDTLFNTTAVLCSALNINLEGKITEQFFRQGLAERMAAFSDKNLTLHWSSTNSHASSISAGAKDAGLEWCRVVESAEGEPVFSLSGAYLDLLPEAGEQHHIIWTPPCSYASRKDLTALYIGNTVAAVVSSLVCQGDVIVPLGFDEHLACILGLILREHRNGMYYIEGQVFIHPGAGFCGRFGTDSGGRPCQFCAKRHSPNRERVRFHFEPDDWMILMSQVILSGLSSPEKRLVTAISDDNAESYAITEEVEESDRESNVDATNAPSFWQNISVNVDVTVRYDTV